MTGQIDVVGMLNAYRSLPIMRGRNHTYREIDAAIAALTRAAESQGEAVYQYRDAYGAWRDTTAEHYAKEQAHLDMRTLYTHPTPAALDADAKPDAWWNGQRPTTDGICIPSINWDREDTNHDIPLFAGFNPQGPVMGDTARLNWLMDNCAVVRTSDGVKWRVEYDWLPEGTYGPLAKSRRAAIDAARATTGEG